MGFTLQLEDTLADDLRQQASDEHTSVEELAHRLMRDALQERIAAKRGRSQNRRRLELIAKKLTGALAATEEAEFQQLQSLAYERAAPFDKALLQTAADLLREVERLPKGLGKLAEGRSPRTGDVTSSRAKKAAGDRGQLS